MGGERGLFEAVQQPGQQLEVHAAEVGVVLGERVEWAVGRGDPGGVLGGYLVAAWLAGIIGNLLLIPVFYGVALRDFGLLIGALALARLATAFRATPSGASTGN
jgi:hypothetical protein